MMIATSGGECVNVGDKSAILAKALYSFADSFFAASGDHIGAKNQDGLNRKARVNGGPIYGPAVILCHSR
jgi:hypothetical protein